ncbi:MAG: right-handed parallel beta-helix repeat-containing protein [Actinomycetota bacterium]
MRKVPVLLAVAAVVLACLPAPAASGPRTLNVPGDFATIQAAVNAAHPGDTVLIAPGRYREAVEVRTPRITIRGLDRNKVLVDGEFKRTNGILVNGADGVTVENLTACCNTKNGVLWSGVKGYEGHYLTAYNNGDYGIFAYDSTGPALWDHSYASGQPDSGFYIGECNPCDAVVTDVISERNALGWSGTNSSGVTIKNSEFRLNALGIVPNSLNSEEDPPATGGLIANNYVHDNGKTNVPGTATFGSFYGGGIVLVGTVGTVVRDNVVRDNGLVGIIAVSYPDTNPGAQQWLAQGNHVENNTVGPGHSQADIALGALVQAGNCFGGNKRPDGAAVSEKPIGLQTTPIWACSNPSTPPGTPEVELQLLQQFVASPRTVDYKTMPKPPAQPNMPGVSSGQTTVKGKTIQKAALPQTGVGTARLAAFGLLFAAVAVSLFIGRAAKRA